MRTRVLLVLAAFAALMPLLAAAAERKTASAPNPAATVKSNAVALDARLAGDEKRTRLVVDLSRETPLAAFLLADPYRVVVDLPEVTFDFAAETGKASRGLITAFRYGQIAPGRSRIVIDAREPVRIDKSHVLPPFESQPARLVLDLVPTDRASFLKSVAVQPRPEVTGSVPAKKHDRAQAARDPRPVVVIDPGHGGIDSGAIAKSGLEEKAVVLAIALKLRERLERTGRYRVVMTRHDDNFIELAERVKIARVNAASLFVSVHADWVSPKESDARGATVYTLSERASDAEAQRIADRENKADRIAGIDLSEENDDVAGILFDLAHRETKNFSTLFARTLIGQMKAVAPLHIAEPQSARFVVLKAVDIPSVLLEVGFLSNAEDLKQLASEAWREKVADSMLASVESFFATQLAVGLGK